MDLDELLDGPGGYILLALVVGGIALGIRKLIDAADVRGLPEGPERLEILRDVRAMRAEGASHRECMARLRERGLRSGVAQSLLIDVEREQPADVVAPRTGEWNGYRFQYPGNWKVAPLFESGGPELGISIEGFGSSSLLLVAKVADGLYDEMLKEQGKQLRDPERTPLDRWGRFRGEGVRFAGAHRKMKLHTEIDVFRPEGASFVAVQVHALEESDLVQPGFHLIQESLTAAS